MLRHAQKEYLSSSSPSPRAALQAWTPPDTAPRNGANRRPSGLTAAGVVSKGTAEQQRRHQQQQEPNEQLEQQEVENKVEDLNKNAADAHGIVRCTFTLEVY